VVQVDPIKIVLKAPMVSALEARISSQLLSSFAFNLNLRRYTEAVSRALDLVSPVLVRHEAQAAEAAAPRQGLTLVHVRAQLEQLQYSFMS
jgi:hypothetical protein